MARPCSILTCYLFSLLVTCISCQYYETFQMPSPLYYPHAQATYFDPYSFKSLLAEPKIYSAPAPPPALPVPIFEPFAFPALPGLPKMEVIPPRPMPQPAPPMRISFFQPAQFPPPANIPLTIPKYRSLRVGYPYAGPTVQPVPVYKTSTCGCKH